MSSGHAATADICRDEPLVEGICVWVVDVVIDTGVVVEACGLPELLHVGVRVVVVEQGHRGKGYEEKAQEVGLHTRIEGLEVRAILLVALIAEDLVEAVEGVGVGHLTVGERAHSVQAGLNHIKGHSCQSTHEAGNNC